MTAVCKHYLVRRGQCAGNEFDAPLPYIENGTRAPSNVGLKPHPWKHHMHDSDSEKDGAQLT